MAVRKPRYSKEEFAQRGNALYESAIRQQVEDGIRQQVEASNEGKILAIDIETGEFEVDETPTSATKRLFERQPDAEPWTLRIGQRLCNQLSN
ncbi:MAG: hypothetical protein HC860_24850 [Alkalinema sp. RU_4_3]|nr:hypothetical protein [Alkalinema sp. RU_4_3]